jgi:putative hydrolase of HD superfamily
MDSLEPLLELLALDRLPRTGWLLAGVPDPESVAAHSFGTALIALALGPRVDPPLDVDRAVSLAVLHDVGEARLGDIPRAGAALLPDGAKRAAEARAGAELTGGLSGLAAERFEEVSEGASREARFVRLCDKLHLGLRLAGYVRAGSRGLGEFQGGLAELDCSEFPPCDQLKGALLADLDAPPTP